MEQRLCPESAVLTITMPTFAVPAEAGTHSAASRVPANGSRLSPDCGEGGWIGGVSRSAAGRHAPVLSLIGPGMSLPGGGKSLRLGAKTERFRAPRGQRRKIPCDQGKRRV